MSTPEWMKKFQEIGQKGEEEVTSGGKEGFVKSTEIRRDDLPEESAPAPAPAPPPAVSAAKSESEDEDDIAALFYSRGAPKQSSDPPEEESSSEEEESDDDSDGVNSEEAVDEPPESQTETSGMPSMTTTTSSGMPSTTTASSSGLRTTTTTSSGMPSSATETSSAMRSTTTSREIEELGDSWVQNRSSDIDSLAAAEVGRQSFNPAESFITEEVLVDEDGNEILVDEDGNEIEVDENGEEIQEDEVEVDENGNEIQEEEILVDENGNEIVERGMNDEVEYTPEVYDDVAALPRAGTAQVYDVEEQRQILGSGKKGKSSRLSWCIPLLVFLIILATVLVVLYFVVFDEDRDSYGMAPTMAPTATIFAQNGNHAAATTVFDRLRNDCSLDAEMPNFLDQCECLGSVETLADDVRDRWEFYAETFVPTIYPEWDDPITSCSPKNQALLWMSSGINNGGEISYFLRLQRYVLAVVFFQQGGVSWTRTRNWLSENNVCDWEGVQCDLDEFVRILNLDQNNMKGKFSDAPAKLNAIEAYYAANNALTGSISNEWFNGNTLRAIDFSGNELSGGFSKDISEDTDLFSINFASNLLDGTIPSEVENISGLTTFNIESNDFSGRVPSSLYSLPLKELSIGGNELTGSIPGDLPDVSTLTSISLGPNLFTGVIPTNLSELTGLKKLSMVGIPDMTGGLPVEYALNLTGLVELSIAGTEVDGGIPWQYTEMTTLETLNLGDNNIRGRIATEFGYLTKLKSLSLNGNILTGTIPSTLGKLTSIQELRLDDNELYGMIPQEFENFLKIQTLTFDNTFMDGRVPSGVCALRNADLTKLVVDCPTLVGESQVDGIICSIPECCTECI